MSYSSCQEKNENFLKFFFSPIFASETRHFARFTLIVRLRPSRQIRDLSLLIRLFFCVLSDDLLPHPRPQHMGTGFNQILSFWNIVR